jgi:hypothetical protein
MQQVGCDSDHLRAKPCLGQSSRRAAMTTTSWKHAVYGDFNTASNWTAGVPASGDAALLTVSGTPYTVMSSQFNTVSKLEMAKNATLDISALFVDVTSGTGTGTLAGTINVGDEAALMLGTGGSSTKFSNTGTIAIDSSGDTTRLDIAGAVTLTGNGRINLAGLTASNGNTILSNGFASTLTNGSALSRETIDGYGTIGDAFLSIVNAAKGVIEDNTGGSTLVIDTKRFTNSGLVEVAGDFAKLDLESDITQTATGKIVAGAGSFLNLDNVNIVGGSISVANGAEINSEVGPSSINTTKLITNAGIIQADGANLTITGSVEIPVILMHSSCSVSPAP